MEGFVIASMAPWRVTVYNMCSNLQRETGWSKVSGPAGYDYSGSVPELAELAAIGSVRNISECQVAAAYFGGVGLAFYKATLFFLLLFFLILYKLVVVSAEVYILVSVYSLEKVLILGTKASVGVFIYGYDCAYLVLQFEGFSGFFCGCLTVS